MTQEPEIRAEVRLLLIPQRFQRGLLCLAHAVPWAGNLGRKKTFLRVAQWFFWPGINQEIQDYCASCPKCLKAGPKCQKAGPPSTLACDWHSVQAD